MVDPLTAAAFVGAGADVLGGLLSFGSSRSAAKRAKRLGIQQAMRINEESDENLRRMTLQRDFEIGGARAAAGAGNILIDSGAPAAFQRALSDQWNNDMRWERRRAGLEAMNAKLGGQATGRQIRSQGVASLLGSAGAAARYFT